MKKWLYELVYRFVPGNWIFGSNSKIEGLVELAIEGRIEPGRAITLGCGLGRETIYLAKKGFEVTGLDFSPTAIKRARRKAIAEGVEVQFIVDDLTNLQDVSGTFDLITDFGALNDMSQKARDLYAQNVFPLTYPGSRYLMFCFEKMLPSNEVERRFAEDFMIEMLSKGSESKFPGGLDLYLMTKK